uniref:Uncharacterized protein n=1 Tax=Lepeophtheirus salmonis TaxID=72036 RepID=A0A0K2UBZ6_LEPSM
MSFLILGSWFYRNGCCFSRDDFILFDFLSVARSYQTSLPKKNCLKWLLAFGKFVAVSE